MTAPSTSDIPGLPDLLQEGPLALCSLQDIAGTLGFEDSSSLTDAQMARIPYLLAKLCRLFRNEAGREFTPGTTTVQLLSLNGAVCLPDPLGNTGTVDEVVTTKGTVIDPSNYSVRNNKLYIQIPTLIGKEQPGTGDPFEVTYTHTGQVPWDVRATMAADVGRYLTIDPTSAVAQSTFLSAEGYHQRIAAWVADVVKLNASDIELARSHRAVRVNLIVHKLSGRQQAYTDWGSWQWGGTTLW